jgi:hypothetical protein
MLELMTRLRTPFVTSEPTEFFFNVLDGTPITCGFGIGIEPDVGYLLILQLCPWCLISNLENKTTVYSQAFEPLHAFKVGTP